MYTRHNNKWTVNELLSLQREYELLGWSIDQIAEKHQRTPNAIMHKLDYEGVKFGKSDYMDYILYWLSEGEEVAKKHRLNYLKRTANMRGDWKKDKMSANNLARVIIWDANDFYKK